MIFKKYENIETLQAFLCLLFCHGLDIGCPSKSMNYHWQLLKDIDQ